MFKRPRIIPCLLLKDGDLVKTEKFRKPRYIGDPINAVKIFNEEEADELCILDISAHKNGRIDFELLTDIASEAFMPMAYGGGIHDFEDAKRLFRIGYEKVIINSSLISNPDVVQEIVSYAGSQSVVASIDVKRKFGRGEKCYIECGEKEINYSLLDYLKYIENLGVGEILLNSINNDGMMTGYNLATVGDITNNTSLPVIACGGAGSLSDMYKVINEAGAHAAAAGSLFIYYGPRKAVLINYPNEEEIKEAGLI